MIKSLDLLKFILCFLIISIHTNPFTSVSSDLDFYFNNTIARLAVPLFFIVSGYLLFKKLLDCSKEKYKEIAKKYLIRIGIIYIVWSIIYIIPFCSILVDFKDFWHIFYHFFADGTYSHLWYLQALIVGTLLLVILNYHLGLKKTFIISIFLYIIGLILVPYFGFFAPTLYKIPILSQLLKIAKIALKVQHIGRNGVTFGFFFITMGAMCAAFPKKKYSKIKNILGIFCSFLLVLGETWFIKNIARGDYFGLQISLALCCYSLFEYFLNLKDIKIKNTIILRKLSILIYLIHPWIVFIYNCLYSWVFKHSVLCGNSFFRFGTVTLVSIILAMIIIHLSDKKKFSFLKKIY